MVNTAFGSRLEKAKQHPIGYSQHQEIDQAQHHFDAEEFHEVRRRNDAERKDEQIGEVFIREQDLVAAILDGIEQGQRVHAQILSDLHCRAGKGRYDSQRRHEEIEDDSDQPNGGDQADRANTLQIRQKKLRNDVADAQSGADLTNAQAAQNEEHQADIDLFDVINSTDIDAREKHRAARQYKAPSHSQMMQAVRQKIDDQKDDDERGFSFDRLHLAQIFIFCIEIFLALKNDVWLKEFADNEDHDEYEW